VRSRCDSKTQFPISQELNALAHENLIGVLTSDLQTVEGRDVPRIIEAQ